MSRGGVKVVHCPKCRSLLKIGITPDCPLCDKSRQVTEEVFLRWVCRSHPHKQFRFHGEGEDRGTLVSVAITEGFL